MSIIPGKAISTVLKGESCTDIHQLKQSWRIFQSIFFLRENELCKLMFHMNVDCIVGCSLREWPSRTVNCPFSVIMVPVLCSCQVQYYDNWRLAVPSQYSTICSTPWLHPSPEASCMGPCPQSISMVTISVFFCVFWCYPTCWHMHAWLCVNNARSEWPVFAKLRLLLGTVCPRFLARCGQSLRQRAAQRYTLLPRIRIPSEWMFAMLSFTWSCPPPWLMQCFCIGSALKGKNVLWITPVIQPLGRVVLLCGCFQELFLFFPPRILWYIIDVKSISSECQKHARLRVKSESYLKPDNRMWNNSKSYNHKFKNVVCSLFTLKYLTNHISETCFY